MLDNILNTVKRGAERVQRRGEEVAHATRLRMEVFQLSRELDALYARLGRSYHAGADVEVLSGVREDIRRVEEEIRARERLITELGADAEQTEQDMPAGSPAGTGLVSVGTPRTEPTVPAAVPQPTQHPSQHPTPEVRMTKDTAETGTHANVPTTPDPTVQHSDEKLPLGDQTASMGNEAARDDMARHQNTIEEGKAASRNPDPLDK